MVSAPETKSTSIHSIPASASASRAAATPYSTKLRPHFPHGCMPTPSTTTSLMVAPVGWPPLPHDVLVVVILIQLAQLELDLVAQMERRGVDVVGELTEHNHLLLRQLDGDDRVRHERLRRHVRLGRRVVVGRERPHRPAPTERHVLTLLTRRRRVGRRRQRRRKEVAPALDAAGTEQGQLVVEREPSFDGWDSFLAHGAPLSRRATVSVASFMMRSMSSATLGRSSISPTPWPVGRMPTSGRPSTNAALVIIGAFAAITT